MNKALSFPGENKLTKNERDTVDTDVPSTEVAAVAVPGEEQDTTAPGFRAAKVNEDKLVLTYDSALDSTNTPSVEDFEVRVGIAARKVEVSEVAISGETVTLTLEKPVLQDQAVKLKYTDPSKANDLNAIQDLSGNDADSLSGVEVVNNTKDKTKPVIESGMVKADGKTLVLTYKDDSPLKETAPSGNAFTVTADDEEITVTEVAINDKAKTVTLTLAKPVLKDQAVTLDYTVPAKNAIQDDKSNKAGDLVDQPINDNNSTKTPPEFESATVNKDTLALTYDRVMDKDIEPSEQDFTVTVDKKEVMVNRVEIQGKKVTLTLATPAQYGEDVTVSYTAGKKGIQDTAGIEAPSQGQDEPVTVTNNTPNAAPAFVAANVIGSRLTITFTDDQGLDPDHVPAPEDFMVKVDKESITVRAVKVDDATSVTLLLEEPVPDENQTQTVVLGYAPPGDGKSLQDVVGGMVKGFNNKPVDNNTKDTTPPEFEAAEVTSKGQVVLTFNNAEDLKNNTPSPDSFTIAVDGVPVGVKDVSVDAKDKTVILTLTEPVKYQQQVVDLAYKAPANKADAIQDDNGNTVKDFRTDTISNSTAPDNTPPTFDKATVSGTDLTVRYGEQYSLDSKNLPDVSAFTVEADGVAIAVKDIAVNARNLSLTLKTPVEYRQAVTIAYRDPGKGNDATALQDAAGNDAASLPATAVENRTPDTTPPEFVKAEINEAQLMLDYSDAQPLDSINLPPNSAFTVKVDGEVAAINGIKLDSNTVQLGLANPVLPKQAVTVAYRDPGKADDTNAIQDKVGNDAPSLGAIAVSNTTRFYTLTVNDPVFTEGGDSEQTILIYSLGLDRIPTVPVTINYATLDTKNTVVFEPGQTQASVSIPVKGLSDREQPLINKTLDVEFSSSRLAASFTQPGENLMANKTPFTTSNQDNLGIKDKDTNLADTFVAEITNSKQANATNTLSGGDYANGGRNRDRIILTATDALPDAITSVIGFELENIEELEIRAYDADGNGKADGAIELGLVNVKGLQTVLSTSSDADVTLNTVQNLVDLDITGNGYSGSAFTLNYINDAVNSKKPKPQKIVLHGFGEGQSGEGKQGLLTVDGISTFRMTVVDKDSIVELAGNKLKTLDLTLDKSVTIMNGSNSFLDTLDKVDVNIRKEDAEKSGSLTADFSGSFMNMKITVGNGDDNIQTGAGNDTVTGGAGNNTIKAGSGFNVITAVSGNNQIITGAENDRITTGNGADTVDAGGSIFIDDDDNTNDYDKVDTGAGDDRVTLGDGKNQISVGEGNDIVKLGVKLDSDDTIDGGAGSNTLEVPDIDSINDPGDFDHVKNFGALVFTKAADGTIEADATVVDDIRGVVNATNLNGVGISTYTFNKGINGDVSINQVAAPDGENITVNLITGTATGESLAVAAKTPETPLNMAFNVTNDQGGLVNETLNDLSLDNIKALALDFQDVNLKEKKADDKNESKVDSLIIKGMTADSLEKLTLSGNGDIRIEGPVSSTSIKTVKSTVATANIQVDVSRATSGVSMETLGGADTLVSGKGADTIRSGDGSDSISSGDGADTIEAGNGNDSIQAGKGDDVVKAGGGNDTITAGIGSENLDGGAGDDTFEFTYSTNVDEQGLTSADTVSGGDGEDKVVILEVSADNVTLVDDIFFQWKDVETLDISKAIDTDFDTDTIAGSATLNAIALGASLKQIITGVNNDYVAIGEGFKAGLTVELNGGKDTIEASTAPADSRVIVYVSAESKNNLDIADELNGGIGQNDTIQIKAGNKGEAITDATNFEIIEIVDGKDKDKGKDRDGLGDEPATVTVTNDVVKPGQVFRVDATALKDPDAVFTFKGNAETSGAFSLVGGAGSDNIITGGGADNLEGGDGNDTLDAGVGSDIVSGGQGKDALYGREGNDVLNGNAGADRLTGGLGKDTLTGGDGLDQFVYSIDDRATGIDTTIGNVDTITDFGSSDTIVFTGIAGADTISRSTLTTAILFKGNFNSFGAAQGAVAKGVEGTTANDGIIEAVYQTDSNTLWIDLNEDAALNADDLQIILTGTASLAQTNFMAG